MRALVWAVDLAGRLGWTVEAVTAWPEVDAVWVHDVPGHFSAPRQRALQAQDTVLAEVRQVSGGVVTVDTDIVNAHPVDALSELAGDARLVVVGAHDARRASRRHPGRRSVGESLALLVECPVVVVHDTSPAERAQAAPRSQGEPITW
jgi:nucleotide-binding universal stress UspA family protein